MIIHFCSIKWYREVTDYRAEEKERESKREREERGRKIKTARRIPFFTFFPTVAVETTYFMSVKHLFQWETLQTNESFAWIFAYA